MKFAQNIFLIILLLVLKNEFAFAQNKTILIETELAFAEAAKNTNTRDAFLKFIDDEGILFRPHPVNGKEFLEKSPARPAKLLWYPSSSFMSSSEDLGVNWGPWEFRKTMEEDPIAFGYFVTIWKKQNDGSWKFLFDMGNGNEKHESVIPAIKESILLSVNVSEKENKNVFSSLIEIEKMLGADSKTNGFKNIYQKFVNKNTTIIRNEIFPVKEENINAFLDTTNVAQKWETLGGSVSSASDLGYTYGKITFLNDSINEAEAKPSFYYLHVWVYDNGWKLLIDLTNPIPEG
ncbi:MAG: hypothetical protein A2068_06850 [Ignavibacteria bacterium GWB2_35_6b]|nr:MAG: hypothetical protein A2068_06850 [Ignavibacteria bacterium GWB2_35_6b]